ncbi:MFS transporter [Trichophyton violaceum]|uniref:MFS transporter n=1 Tax=Trichophyton violaceum TaxID=34388 RepID=A0A178FC43_TRIVO|nr:MFS transporter [Trichophyton violaceum]
MASEGEQLNGHALAEIILIPKPTTEGSDPLMWSMSKKSWQLFLLCLYACTFSYGENMLGAAWTTVSREAEISLDNMNGGSALNYLLLGLVNIFWVPIGMKLGRRPVFLITTTICMLTAVWLGYVHGTAQWMTNLAINGFGVAAYQAVIQLSVFDMFFAHQRGRTLSFYLFGQQLGSILGPITGGIISDGPGWRWTQWICSMIFAVVLILLFTTFEETLFPRFLFAQDQNDPNTSHKKDIDMTASLHEVDSTSKVSYHFPKRTYLRRLKLWIHFPQDKTTYWQYFRRPFVLFLFPNIIIAGVIFAFGCTAGIVSFGTISRITSKPPYNWSTTSTGLIYLAALAGNIVGWATGMSSDFIVMRLARRNHGIKEAEMRLWTLCVTFVYAAVGYMLYGWGAHFGMHWITIAIGLGCMIAHQVSACSVATAYAMECFPGISGELVVVLSICSSVINFPLSFTVQQVVDMIGFGYAFVFYGFCVLASMAAAIPAVLYGKSWRRRAAPKWKKWLAERDHID